MCDIYLVLRRNGKGVMLAPIPVAVTAVFCAVLRHRLAWLLEVTDVFHRSVWITALANRHRLPGFFYVDGSIPWLNFASIGGLITGVLAFVVMLPGLLLIDRFLPDLPPRLTRWIRVIADSTFALYVFHFPVLVLLRKVVPHWLNSRPGQLLVLLGLPAILVGVARWMDALKLAIREYLRRRLSLAKFTS
jgi:peptidoglycan/LPS O-acetylase OafA/YrhL